MNKPKQCEEVNTMQGTSWETSAWCIYICEIGWTVAADTTKLLRIYVGMNKDEWMNKDE